MASIRLSRHEAEEGDLPDTCMLCDNRATVKKRRRFISHPLWIYILLPCGLIPYLILAAILTETALCYTQFCNRHKNHWRNRSLLIWGAFVLLMPTCLGSLFLINVVQRLDLEQPQESFVIFSILIGQWVLILCWLASIPISQKTAVHPTKVTERGLTLTGIAPDFAEAVEEHRRAQRSSKRRDDEEDEEDD